MDKSTFFLIDATGLCYRAFYAIRELRTSSGQPTNAVYGFLNMLNKLLKDRDPFYIAACFDVSRDTFRAKKFAEYKINRRPMPDELVSQMSLIKELLKLYGITVIEKEGYEADDLLATLASYAVKKGFKAMIITSDKDMLQLAAKDVELFNPYKDKGVLFNEEKVKELYGVLPKQIPDVVALMGDAVDNIPGISGIGDKTATSLISQFGSIENLLKDTSKIAKEKLKKTIEENKEQIRLNKDLAILDSAVDFKIAEEDLKKKEPDNKELFRLFTQLEFRSLLKTLASELGENVDHKEQDLEEADISALKNAREIIIYAGEFDRLAVSFDAKFAVCGLEDPAVKQMLSAADVLKTGHNLKELKVLFLRQDLSFEGLYFDIAIAAYLLDPSKSDYSLSSLAWNYLGQMLSEGAVSPGKALGLIRRLLPILQKKLAENGLTDLFNQIEMPLVRVLAEMEFEGVKIDKEVLASLSKDIEHRLIKLIENIYRISDCQFNINSPKQLREVLFQKLKLPVVKKGKTGPSTDEDTLKTLAVSHELPAHLLDYRQLMKLKCTYVDALPELADQTGRIHTSFNQTGTETGRLSSTNPNLQNIPAKTDLGRNIRKCVIAFNDDDVLLSCDYSQIELRILAHFSQDKNLIEAFRQGKDIHKNTAALIYGVEENAVTTQMRETAKRVNFSITYGLTAFGLSRDLDIDTNEAQNFIDAYFLRYPGVSKYISQQLELARKNGFVRTLMGRRRYIPEINNKNSTIRSFAERQAVNAPIQGTASDLIKKAMVDIHRKINAYPRMRSRMLLQIHDELVFNAPQKEVADLVPIIKDKMENAAPLDVPLLVAIKKGKNWMEMEQITDQER